MLEISVTGSDLIFLEELCVSCLCLIAIEKTFDFEKLDIENCVIYNSFVESVGEWCVTMPESSQDMS